MMPGVSLPKSRQCKVERCASVNTSRGYCGRHATQLKRFGAIQPDMAPGSRVRPRPRLDYEPKSTEDILEHSTAREIMASFSSDEERQAFRDIIEDYRTATLKLLGRRFVFVKALAELVRLGWRKTGGRPCSS